VATADIPSTPPPSPARDEEHDDVEALLRDIAQAPEMERGTTPRTLLPESLGHYRIVEPLARGGMGEVYKAYDTNLQRFVALKILPGELARDEAQVRRFLQEARAASALNHPNIVTIYEMEVHRLDRPGGAAHCIAMELVDGLTLREWLHQAKPSLEQLEDVFTQIAQGLAKAHEAGIVHRDLKPENVMVTADGYAKILDFGLAKLNAAPFDFGGKTVSPDEARLTRTGMVVGTVGYMAPEQVRGQAVDTRCDIFAFGSMLFEALTGIRAFGGESAVDILHAVLHGEPPPVSTLCPLAPAELDRIVARCLAKDPAGRYPTTRELALELRALHHRREEPARRSQPRGRRRLFIGGIITLAAAGAVIGAALTIPGGEPARPASPREPLRIERLTYSGRASMAAVSPDGKVVVHAVTTGGRSSLWVRQVVTSSSLQIVPPAEATFLGVAVSPDGNYVYYVLQRGLEVGKRLYRVPILGGTPRRLVAGIDSPVAFSPKGKRIAYVHCASSPKQCALIVAGADGSAPRPLAARFGGRPSLPAWSPDGKRIAFVTPVEGPALRLTEVPAEGGKPRALSPQTFTEVAGLAWLPGGRSLILAASERANRPSQLWSISFPSGATSRITNDPNSYSGVSLTEDGRSLISTQVSEVNNLWTLPIGERGPARRLTRDAGRIHTLATGRDGRIVYSALESGAWDLWALDGNAAPRRLTSDAGGNFEPALSPDARTVAFISDRGGSSAVWRMELDGSGARRLTSGPRDHSPAFTADGRWVIYTATPGERPVLWKVPVQGGTPLPLTTSPTAGPALSPDGKRIAAGYWDEQPDSPWKIAILPIAGGPPERAFELPPTARATVEWTPDGQGLSYVDDRGGASSIWVQPLTGPPRKVSELDSDIVFQHRWSSKGDLVVIRGMRASDIVILRGFL
jgi:Tol biopolymer transport system component